MTYVPESRIKLVNENLPKSEGYILYWMSSCRRLSSNYALDLAVARAADSGRALVIVETLFCDEPWACDRLHQFVIEGMRENSAEAEKKGVTYFAWVESSPDALLGRLEQLAEGSSIVITDDFPSRFQSQKIAQLGENTDVQLETVDSNGLLPLRASDQIFKRAFSFRRFLQANLPEHLHEFPSQNPLKRLDQQKKEDLEFSSDADILQVGPGREFDLGDVAIDHSVDPVAKGKGGFKEAARYLERFVSERLSSYAELRNQPDLEVTSELSPYLHFGHISPHQILHSIAATESWSPEQLTGVRKGQRRAGGGCLRMLSHSWMNW